MPLTSAADLGTRPEGVAARLDQGLLDQVRALQARVRQIEDAHTVETQPVLPPLEPLFSARGLRVGSAYAVDGSTALAMALMAGASASGSWCGVVGVPEFGAEAAAAIGVALDRTVLVPEPVEHWIAVTAALVDVLPVVVLRAPDRVREADAARLSARLRQRGSTLVALGAWPRCEARLSIVDSRWEGIADGRGHLSGRRVTIEIAPRSGRSRTTGLWLSDRVEPAGGQALAGVGHALDAEQVAS
ncbi:hypothetical protein [Solicola gregarius]|uniref:Protein ImuA n=1 Tax=Solicola gregarius TaxID=2908642 RepID=A0AA46YMM1_9ACTN|nr:hypothetical protein [Solicola gregarius]UYM05878.1 hypothetical protein L0C25_02040 [Solicola gregarius]